MPLVARSYLIALLPILLIPVALRAATPSFAEHIAPIIWKNCVSCHRSGEIAPFPLTNYQEVSSRAAMIKYVTTQRSMPPWKPVSGYGNFADPRVLSQQDIDMIAAWADNGAPEGDASKTPPLPTLNNGSQLGTPDLVLKMPEVWHHKNDNKDIYRNFVIPTNMPTDKVVSAIEFRPDNKKIVHHALIFVDTTGEARKLDEKDPLPGYSGFGGPGVDVSKNLLGWVPGATARFFPQGLGITIPKGADIILQLHYAPTTELEDDQSSINIFFAKDGGTVREIEQTSISTLSMLNGPLIIPADSIRHFVGTIKGAVIRADVSLLAIAPHMHLLGKDCRAYAIPPKGDTIHLIKIDEWDFHWQGYYMFKNPVRIPKNSTIYYEATYDNTSNNPENPNNPPKTVRWGESTFDEMFLNYFLYVPYRAGDEDISMETPLPTSVHEESDYSSSTSEIAIYPQPVQDRATLSYRLAADTEVRIELSDMLGRVVQQFTTQGVYGMNTTSLSLQAMAEGLYMVHIYGGGQHLTGNLLLTGE